MIQVLRETQKQLADVARALEVAGGRNLFGEANYRAVWGWARLDWVGGKGGGRDPVSGGVWGGGGAPRPGFGGAGARSGGAAARAEVCAAQSLAHRAVGAGGELWFSG